MVQARRILENTVTRHNRIKHNTVTRHNRIKHNFYKPSSNTTVSQTWVNFIHTLHSLQLYKRCSQSSKRKTSTTTLTPTSLPLPNRSDRFTQPVRPVHAKTGGYNSALECATQSTLQPKGLSPRPATPLHCGR